MLQGAAWDDRSKSTAFFPDTVHKTSWQASWEGQWRGGWEWNSAYRDEHSEGAPSRWRSSGSTTPYRNQRTSGLSTVAGVADQQLVMRHRQPGVSKGKEFNDIIIGAESDLPALLEFIGQKLNEFSAVNAVTALHRVAKSAASVGVAGDPRLQLLIIRTLHIFKSAVPEHEPLSRRPGTPWNFRVDMRALTNAVWSEAKLLVDDPEMQSHVSDQVIARIGENTPQQMANCAWAFAKLGKRNDQLLTIIAQEACTRLREFSPQNLMCLLWACAKLYFLHLPLMEEASISAMTRLEDFSAQHLSITAWACATLGYRNVELMERVATESMRSMRLFTPQNLANLAWAFATLDMRHDKLYNAISLSARQRLKEFNQQHLCNLAWAFSALQVADEELLLAIAAEVIGRVGDFDSQGLSNVACAFAVLGLAHQEMFEAISLAATERIERGECQPRDLESLAWAFARLGIEKEALMSAISSASLERIHELRALDLANVAWAFAQLGLADEPLFLALGREATLQIADFSPQALGHLAWAFSTLSLFSSSPELLEAISLQVRARLPELELPHVAVLLDSGLSCSDVLARRMGAMVCRFLTAFPKSEEEWKLSHYPAFLKKLQVDNFGFVGTLFLLARLGIDRAPLDFCNRAAEQMHSYIRQNNDVLKGLTAQDVLHKRVCCFAEYNFIITAPASTGTTVTPLAGALLRENGYWTASAARGGKCRWLQAAQGLKAGALVDRTLCSEFQMLEELCDWIEKVGGTQGPEHQAAVRGGVRLYVSTTPCISCVGAMNQFLLMFPNVTLEVACGKVPIRQGWKKDVKVT